MYLHGVESNGSHWKSKEAAVKVCPATVLFSSRELTDSVIQTFAFTHAALLSYVKCVEGAHASGLECRTEIVQAINWSKKHKDGHKHTLSHILTWLL